MTPWLLLFATIVDLTHVLDANFPYIPVDDITFPFALQPIATVETHGVAANAWRIHEHLGTQIDAPNHFALGGRALHQLRTDELFAPLVVIDVRERAERDNDLELTVADLEAWERDHGRLPPRALVAMYAGWEQRIGDGDRYLQPDGQGVLHFPGFSADAVIFLARERNVWGVGVDTISFDPGRDRDFRAHKALLAEDRFALEALANLESVPVLGARVFIGATKVRDATGGPVRVVAQFDDKVPTLAQTRAAKMQRALIGRWRSDGPEPLNGKRVVREFAFTRVRWSVTFTIFDASGVMLTRGENHGSYRLLPGTQADGSLLAEFDFEGPRVSARAQSCARELDRVRVDGNRLRLGVRPADGDMCTPDKRPVQLGSPLLRR